MDDDDWLFCLTFYVVVNQSVLWGFWDGMREEEFSIAIV